MHERVIMVVPFGKEQAKGKLRSQDSFLQSQVAACLRIRMLCLNISQT